MEKGFVQSNQPTVPGGPSQEPAHDIAAPLIARHHSVTDEKTYGAGVIGDDPKGNIGIWFNAVSFAGDSFGRGY
jgi:hypothetical protein